MESVLSLNSSDFSPLQVYLRIKPNTFSNSEHSSTDEKLSYDCSKENNLLISNFPQRLIFDKIFDTETCQYDVFKSIEPILILPLNGYDSTIFAYGQTNSGKTHTMLGPNGKLSLSLDLMGIIPRASRFLFAQIHKIIENSNINIENDNKINIQYQIRSSYLEIYNGRVYDLLSNNRNNNKSSNVLLREDNEGNVNIINAQAMIVNNSEELENVLIQGNNNRSTASTSMNNSSSRSHALLIIYIERREIISSSREYISYLGKLNLVDLAGSEDINRSKAEGDRFREAVNINTGLLQLRRVLDALANNDNHIPYRDSILTRLLQSSLSSKYSITLLLSHISSLNIDRDETINTLKYSQIAKSIKRSSPLIQSICKKIDYSDPMYMDYNDPIPYYYRRTVYIKTNSYGNIFARVAGCSYNENQKCLLFIHGSGSDNSSLWWNNLVKNLLSNTSPSPYYFVSIDCPGYGRSEGDKQIIRSYPGLFLQEIINIISPINKSVYCLIGSSQGAASIFNAILEKPNLSLYLAVQDPVSHDPIRFKTISQPTLLMYDTEDLGHPVSVGRLVRKYLPNNHYYEFTNSKQPNWLNLNAHSKLLKLFSDYNRENQILNSNKDDVKYNISNTDSVGLPTFLSSSITIAGGIISYLSSYNREPINDESTKELKSIQSTYETASVTAAMTSKNDLFNEKSSIATATELEAEEKKHQMLIMESNQTQCDYCNNSILDLSTSLRIEECRHLLCYSCCCITLGINPDICSVAGCDVKINNKQTNIKYPVSKSIMDEKHIIIEFGNICKVLPSKYEYTSFIHCKSSQTLIDNIAFDINPDYPQSAIKVNKPPYELTRIMNLEYSCDFIINWNKQLCWPRLRIKYNVQNKQKIFRRNLLVKVPKQRNITDTDNTNNNNHNNNRASKKSQFSEVQYIYNGRDANKPTLNYVQLK